ncbi:MAG: helix-turn-helix domain-containing protein [Ignavibacteriaceae bacterium]
MIGETILHYKILQKLGEGGMGVVYLAEDRKLKRQVAIKFLPHHISANEVERKRFEIEAQAAASLNHPNIATIYAIEESGDDTFIVMEYRRNKERMSIPSLHERREDIPLLAEHLLKSFAAAQKKQAKAFDADLQLRLRQQLWRGNIRELQNFIERIVTTAPAEVEILKESHLPPDFRKEYKESKQSNDLYLANQSLNENLEAIEAKLIKQALIENNWNQSQAARTLKIAGHTMRYKMKKLGITNPHV